MQLKYYITVTGL